MLSCNHDCFNCPYPDVPDECLSDSLTYDEYKESDQLDSEIRYERKTNKEKKMIARQKVCREANKEKIAARNKANYKAHREERIAHRKAYREANKEYIYARRKANIQANKEKLSDKQKCIRVARKSRSMTQRDLASLLSVSRSTISWWEIGYVQADWDKLCAVLPELEEYRP